MTFKQAYEYAMAHSEAFRRHDARVKAAIANEEPSACMIFSVSPDETFYYGYDGYEIEKGKHSKYRASVLLNRENAVLIIQ